MSEPKWPEGIEHWADPSNFGEPFFGLDRTVEPYRFSEEYGERLRAEYEAMSLAEQGDHDERRFSEGLAVALGIVGMFQAVQDRCFKCDCGAWNLILPVEQWDHEDAWLCSACGSRG